MKYNVGLESFERTCLKLILYFVIILYRMNIVKLQTKTLKLSASHDTDSGKLLVIICGKSQYVCGLDSIGLVGLN